MCSVSSKVMLPELPDASMDTRKPIRCPQKTAGLRRLRPALQQNNFQNDGRACLRRQPFILMGSVASLYYLSIAKMTVTEASRWILGGKSVKGVVFTT